MIPVPARLVLMWLAIFPVVLLAQALLRPLTADWPWPWVTALVMAVAVPVAVLGTVPLAMSTYHRLAPGHAPGRPQR